MRPLVYALPGNEAFAAGLARALPASAGALEVRQFPDGESLVRLVDSPAGRDVILCCTLHHPDSKILPLLIAADTARGLGARSVGLVAPYLAYMRQDARFHPGEALSALSFAQTLSERFDWLATVDPHLHRFKSLSQVFPIPTAVVPAAPLLAHWVRSNVERPLLIGPDEESAQWVSSIAAQAGAPYLVLEKHRSGDRQVEIAVPDLSKWKDRTPVVADDIVSTGATQARILTAVRAQGLPAACCLAVHAVFAQGAHWMLLEAGASRLVTTNTIPYVTSEIDVAPAMAPACASLIAQRGSRRRA